MSRDRLCLLAPDVRIQPIDFDWCVLLKRIAAFELLARPELDSRQAQGQSFQSHGQARMHENLAYGLSVRFNVHGFSTRHSVNGTDESGLLALIGKFRCIVQNQYRPLRGAQARAGGFEMPPQNVMLVDSIIGCATKRTFANG